MYKKNTTILIWMVVFFSP